MPESSNEIIELTAKLLESVSAGDWETYTALCDAELTAFEPEGARTPGCRNGVSQVLF